VSPGVLTDPDCCSLGYNEIGEVCGEALAQALESNQTLTKLE
jgi:hypothetical protein